MLCMLWLFKEDDTSLRLRVYSWFAAKPSASPHKFWINPLFMSLLYVLHIKHTACNNIVSWVTTQNHQLSIVTMLQGALDATGACCDGVVDNFGVCNGYDASGVFQVALAEGSSIATLASALGLSSSKILFPSG